MIITLISVISNIISFFGEDSSSPNYPCLVSSKDIFRNLSTYLHVVNHYTNGYVINRAPWKFKDRSTFQEANKILTNLMHTYFPEQIDPASVKLSPEIRTKVLQQILVAIESIESGSTEIALAALAVEVRDSQCTCKDPQQCYYHQL